MKRKNHNSQRSFTTWRHSDLDSSQLKLSPVALKNSIPHSCCCHACRSRHKVHIVRRSHHSRARARNFFLMAKSKRPKNCNKKILNLRRKKGSILSGMPMDGWQRKAHKTLINDNTVKREEREREANKFNYRRFGWTPAFAYFCAAAAAWHVSRSRGEDRSVKACQVGTWEWNSEARIGADWSVFYRSALFFLLFSCMHSVALFVDYCIAEREMQLSWPDLKRSLLSHEMQSKIYNGLIFFSWVIKITEKCSCNTF